MTDKVRSTGRIAGLRFRLAPAAVIPGHRRFKSTIQTEIASIGSSDAIKESVETVAESSNEIIHQVAHVAPDQIGYFQSLGLAQSWVWPTGLFQHIFEYVNVTTGLPWWATIALVTVGTRAALFPMYLKASNANAKMTQIKPELNRLVKKFNESQDQIEGQKALLERKRLLKDNGIKTTHLMLPVATVPFFIGLFAALNGMAKAPVVGMVTEGLAWFPNLALPDPYMGLQILTASFYSLTFRLGGEAGATSMSPAMKKIFTWMPFIAVPLTMGLPAGTCLYFCLSGLLAIMQSLLLKNPAFRRWLNLAPILPPPPTEAGGDVSIVDSIKQSFERAKERAEKAQRDAEREAALRRERAELQKSQFVQIKPSKIVGTNKGKPVKKGEVMRG